MIYQESSFLAYPSDQLQVRIEGIKVLNFAAVIQRVCWRDSQG